MARYDDANRLANRATRVVDELAQEIASLSFDGRAKVLTGLAIALEEVGKAKEIIVQQDPALEYHFDPERPPTKYMRDIQKYIDAANRLLKRKDFDGAIYQLNLALEMEPPPIVHEAIRKRVQEASDLQW